MYLFPDQDSDNDANLSRQQRRFNKLNQRYENNNRGGPPELTEEERFQLEKERQANSLFAEAGAKDKKRPRH